ncbi:MAG: CBS domain-containing protein [Deltaproteobacteria bacterium]|nr:CBS domain-containing protein [Deltaproteobacteria bacterium]
MSGPVVSCGNDTFVADALQWMLLGDVQRLFVHGKDASRMIGVLSLSDAALVRSGTCQPCVTSRIMSIQ